MNALRLIGMSIVVVAWISAPAAADSRCAALHDAVWKDDGHSVGALLRQGVDVNCRDKGPTPLMTAVASLKVNMVRLLLQHGADVTATNRYGESVMDYYLLAEGEDKKTQHEIGILLDEAEAKVKGPMYPDSLCQALHEAVFDKNPDTTTSVLDQGFDVNCRDRNRFTALIKAAGMGHSAVVRVLLRNGADVNARDTRGATAFKHAKESFLLSHLAGPPPAEKEQDFNEVIRLLRQAGGVR